jgi:hypothetical protein
MKGADEKKRRDPEDVNVGLRSCLQLALLFIVVALVIWTVYTQIVVLLTRNRLDYHRRCIFATEYNVLPLRAPATLRSPAPFARGFFAVDYDQLEVRWHLTAVTYDGANKTLGSLDLRGPLHEHGSDARRFVAPVALAMGLQKDKRGRHYEGIMDINGKLADDILERPDAYYVSFALASNGEELMRDTLMKSCPPLS